MAYKQMPLLAGARRQPVASNKRTLDDQPTAAHSINLSPYRVNLNSALDIPV